MRLLVGMAYPLLIAVLFYLVVMRRGGTSWSSYYLFWFLGPAVAALLLAHPAILLLVPVALVARRWIPDPWLAVKYAGRVRSIDADVRANPDNITARRNLAVIWLEKRRPQRALALLEQALKRDPEDIELHHLRGIALLGARRWEASVDELLEVLRREPRFRYGEAYLRLRRAHRPSSLGRGRGRADQLHRGQPLQRGGSVQAGGGARRSRRRRRRGRGVPAGPRRLPRIAAVPSSQAAGLVPARPAARAAPPSVMRQRLSRRLGVELVAVRVGHSDRPRPFEHCPRLDRTR